MPYRQNSNSAIELAKNSFSFPIATSFSKRCPNCNYSLIQSKFCQPHKKLCISSFLFFFFRKYCPINSSHFHCKCPCDEYYKYSGCNFEWIAKPNNVDILEF